MKKALSDGKKKIGRPSDYTPELGGKLCAELAKGRSLRSVVQDEGMPSDVTFFSWLTKHPEFLRQYEQAKEQSTNKHLETIEELGDEAIRVAQQVDAKSSNAVVSAYKLKADNLKWVMSKLKAKKYGDKVDVTSDGKAIQGNTINFGNFKEK